MAISRHDNDTRMAESLRDSLEHILNYLATEDNSELDKAIEAAKDAQAQSHTRRETVASKYLANLAASVSGDIVKRVAR